MPNQHPAMISRADARRLIASGKLDPTPAMTRHGDEVYWVVTHRDNDSQSLVLYLPLRDAHGCEYCGSWADDSFATKRRGLFFCCDTCRDEFTMETNS